jgi:hypothetical protein
MSQFKFMVTGTGTGTRFYQAQCCKPATGTPKTIDVNFDVSGGQVAYFVRSFITISTIPNTRFYSPYVGFRSPINTNDINILNSVLYSGAGIVNSISGTSYTFSSITVNNITSTSATIVYSLWTNTAILNIYLFYKTASGAVTSVRNGISVASGSSYQGSFTLTGLTGSPTDYFFTLVASGSLLSSNPTTGYDMSFRTSGASRNIIVSPITNSNFRLLDSTTSPFRFRIDISGVYMDEANVGSTGVEVLTAASVGATTTVTLTPTTILPQGQVERGDFLIIDRAINATNSLLYSSPNVVYTGVEVSVTDISGYRTATGLTGLDFMKAIASQLIYARENLRALMTSYATALERYNGMKTTFGLPDISGTSYNPALVPTPIYSTTDTIDKVSNGGTTTGAVSSYNNFITSRNTFLTYLRRVVDQIATGITSASVAVTPNTYTPTESTHLSTATQSVDGSTLTVPVVNELITSFASATGILKTFAYDKATDAVTKYNDLWNANSQYLPADARKYPSPNPLTANTPFSDLVTNYTYFAIQGPAAPAPSGSGSGGSGTTPLSYIGDLYYTIWCVVDKSRQNYNNLLNAYNNFRTSVADGAGVNPLSGPPTGINTNISESGIPASTYDATRVTSLNEAMTMLGIDGNVDTIKTAYATNKLQKLRNFVIEQMTAYITAFDTLQGNLAPTTQTLTLVSTTPLSNTMTTNSLIAAMAKYGNVMAGAPVTYSAPAGAILNAYSSLTLAQKRDAVLDLMTDMTNLMEATSGGYFWNAGISGISISHNDPTNGSSSTLGAIWNGIGTDTTAVPNATADVCDRKLTKYTNALTGLVAGLKSAAETRITSYENLWDAFDGLRQIATSAFGPLNNGMTSLPPKASRTNGLSGLIYPTQTIANIRNTLSSVRTGYFEGGTAVRPALVTRIIENAGVPTFTTNCNTAVGSNGRLSLSATSPTSQTALTITISPALATTDTDTTLLGRIRECVQDATAMTIRTYADLYSRLGSTNLPASVRGTTVVSMPSSLTISGLATASGISTSYTESGSRIYTDMVADYVNYSKAIQMLYEAMRVIVVPMITDYQTFKGYYASFAGMPAVTAIKPLSTTFPVGLPSDGQVTSDKNTNLPQTPGSALPTLTEMTSLNSLTTRYAGSSGANEILLTFVKGQINDNGGASGDGFVQAFYNKVQTYAPTSSQLVTAVAYNQAAFNTDLGASNMVDLTAVMVRFGLQGTGTTAGALLSNQQVVEDRYKLILLVQTYNSMIVNNGPMLSAGDIPSTSPSIEILLGTGSGSIYNMSSTTNPSLSTTNTTYTNARNTLFGTLKTKMNSVITLYSTLYSGLSTFKGAVEASAFTTINITDRDPRASTTTDSAAVDGWTSYTDANNSALNTMRDKYYVDFLSPLVNSTRSLLRTFFDTYASKKDFSAAPANPNSYPDVSPTAYSDVSGALTPPVKNDSTAANTTNATNIATSASTLTTHLTNYGTYVGNLITATRDKLRTLPLLTPPSATSTSTIDKFIYDYTEKQADITQVLASYPRLGGTVISTSGWATLDHGNVSNSTWAQLIDLQDKYLQLNEDLSAALGNYSVLSTARTNALTALLAYNLLYSANSSVIDTPLLRYYSEFTSYFNIISAQPVTSATFNSKTETELNQITARFTGPISAGPAYQELSAIILPMRRIDALNAMGAYNTFIARLKEYTIVVANFTTTELSNISTYVTAAGTTGTFNGLTILELTTLATNYKGYGGTLISTDTTIGTNVQTLIGKVFNSYGPSTDSLATPFVRNLSTNGAIGGNAATAKNTILVASNRNILDQIAEMQGFLTRVEYAGLTGQYTQCLTKDVQSKGFLNWIFG